MANNKTVKSQYDDQTNQILVTDFSPEEYLDLKVFGLENSTNFNNLSHLNLQIFDSKNKMIAHHNYPIQLNKPELKIIEIVNIKEGDDKLVEIKFKIDHAIFVDH